MGFLNEGINEVIATTGGNAAPIGIICRHGALSMVLFRGSHTEANVRKNGWVVANLTHDPLVWVRTAFDDLPLSDFTAVEAGGLPMERLRECEAWAGFTAAVEHETADRVFVTLVPLVEEVVCAAPRAHNRGFAGIVEAAVHGTRYVLNRDPALKALIDHHLAVARKCGGVREREAAAALEGYIGGSS